jgi:head-tail adaptor
MSYPAGFREDFITPLNRKAATVGKYGVDSAGVTWEEGTPMHANVDFQKGKSAMNAGALDAYAVKIVRMNFTSTINERSRIKYDGKIYQIMPETFNGNYRKNTLQFLMQLVNEKEQAAPTPAPSEDTQEEVNP